MCFFPIYHFTKHKDYFEDSTQSSTSSLSTTDRHKSPPQDQISFHTQATTDTNLRLKSQTSTHTQATTKPPKASDKTATPTAEEECRDTLQPHTHGRGQAATAVSPTQLTLHISCTAKPSTSLSKSAAATCPWMVHRRCERSPVSKLASGVCPRRRRRRLLLLLLQTVS